jgi:chaperonin GroES
MLRPFDARVLVTKPKREEQTSSGIILPDTVNEQGQTALGVVQAVGPGSRNAMSGEPMDMGIEVGQTIVYTKFSATEMEYEGNEYHVVTERDIIAVVEEWMPLSRFGRRHERTFGKEKEEWDGNFRQPPKPDSYYTKIKGQCRWCGNMIVKDDGTINERRSWHEDCATEYMIIYHSREQRAQVRKRDKGVCNHCGKFAMK